MTFFTSNENYGKKIENLIIDGKPALYPVFNERQIRAGAGIMFLIGISTMFIVSFTRDYTLLYIVVPTFFIDFLIKVVNGTKYSLIAFIAGLCVRGQRPEFVGAIQKRFAWSIGLFMSFLMIFLVLILGIHSYNIPKLICGTCLIFMWMESSLGICVGCHMYFKLIQIGIIKKPEIFPACPGGACPISKK